MKKLKLLAYALFCLGIGAANAQIVVQHSFGTSPMDDAAIPYGSLTLAPGNIFYGMTYAGGKYDGGSIFSITAGGVYDTLHSFEYSYDFLSIEEPFGNITVSASGTILYGMTEHGGPGGYGTIFSMHSDGTHFGVISYFYETGTSGAFPVGSLTLSITGDTLFGMTRLGGKYGVGCIFCVDTAINSTPTDLWDFRHDSVSPYGNSPYGTLALSPSGKVLYGMTRYGGVAKLGVVFSINTNGSNYKDLLVFNSTNGANPTGSLTLSESGKVLYGMTPAGGVFNDGCIFSIDSDGTAYTTLHDFDGEDGYGGYGSLNIVGGILCGMTERGIVDSAGTIFTIHRDGSGFSTIYSFNSSFYLGLGYSSLVADGSRLFGMTEAGGTLHNGTIFSAVECTLDLTASVDQDVLCYGDPTGKATAHASLGTSPYTYSWSGGHGTDSVATGLSYGTYTVTVTDYNGCDKEASVTITRPAALEISIASQTDPSCPLNNGSITANAATGGTSPYTYLWSPGGQTNLTASGLGADTTFTITVTDNHGCPAAASASLDCSGEHKAEKNGANNSSSNPQLTDIVVYPNPNNGQFIIAGLAKGADIEIYDYTGRKIGAIMASNETIQYDLCSQPNGVYLIRIISKEGTIISQNKVVKMQ